MMSTDTEQEKKPRPPKPHKVKATVSFPISPKGPYKKEASPELVIGKLRADAMAHFRVTEDSEHEYYLSHEGAKVADEKTVGEIAGEAKEVKFTLVKELIQG
jgi:hypothetical protein